MGVTEEVEGTSCSSASSREGGGSSETASVAGKGIAVPRPESAMEVEVVEARSLTAGAETEKEARTDTPMTRSKTRFRGESRNRSLPGSGAGPRCSKERKGESTSHLCTGEGDTEAGEDTPSPSPTPRVENITTTSCSKMQSTRAGDGEAMDVAENDGVLMPPPSCGTTPTEGVTPIGTPQKKKKRGAPYTTGEFVDHTAAKKLLNDEMERSLKLKAEVELAKELEEWEAQLRNIEVDAEPNNSRREKGVEEEDRSTEGLARAANIHLGKIHLVAKKSRHLKGTFSKALNDAADAM